MKLELKHIAPYFPYELQLLEEFELNTPDIVTLRGVEIDMLITTLKRFPYNQRLSFYEAKPILRPLSDLTKEITIDEETFIPLVGLAKISFPKISSIKARITDNHYVYLGAGYSFHFYNSSDGVFFSCKRGYDGNRWDYECCVTNQLELFQKLFEWHFDIFSLIKNNLAVDINKM